MGASSFGLGTFTQTGQGGCPAQECIAFEVACPGVTEIIGGVVSIERPTVGPRGVVTLFSGGSGTPFWSAGGSAAGGFLAQLKEDGFVVVEVAWADPWWRSAPGEDAGTAHLACRPATTIDWVYDSLYAPLGLDPSVGECGFCISGNSGGASQVSYALSHYGLEWMLDAVVPTSGPPHGAQKKGCLRVPGEEMYWYADGDAGIIDAAHGFTSGGPCVGHDAAWASRWKEESVATGGNDYHHPATRVHVILGAEEGEGGVSPHHARDYVAKLEDAASPHVVDETVKGMPHTIQESDEGLAALRSALLAGAAPVSPECADDPEAVCGTSGDDDIEVVGDGRTVYAGAGDDVVRIKGKGSVVFAGPGDDLVFGGAGRDELRGGRGRDVLRGRRRPDALFGGRGHDSLYGGRGKDTLRGGPGKDMCRSGPGRDIVRSC